MQMYSAVRLSGASLKKRYYYYYLFYKYVRGRPVDVRGRPLEGNHSTRARSSFDAVLIQWLSAYSKDVTIHASSEFHDRPCQTLRRRASNVKPPESMVSHT